MVDLTTNTTALKLIFTPADIKEALTDYLKKKAPGLIENRRIETVSEKAVGQSDPGFHISLVADPWQQGKQADSVGIIKPKRESEYNPDVTTQQSY